MSKNSVTYHVSIWTPEDMRDPFISFEADSPICINVGDNIHHGSSDFRSEFGEVSPARIGSGHPDEKIVVERVEREISITDDGVKIGIRVFTHFEPDIDHHDYPVASRTWSAMK
jgi:hypothetical protein